MSKKDENIILPTKEEMEELINYLPILYNKEFKSTKKIITKCSDGTPTFPYYEYDDMVSNFFHVASKKCWHDSNYSENKIKIEQNNIPIEDFTLLQIKTMLTFFVRGERFCDGVWNNAINSGKIKKLLIRLQNIKKIK